MRSLGATLDRPDPAARHQVDQRRRADGPVQRVQGRHRGVPGGPARHVAADARRPDRLQRRALRRRAALLRAGALPRRRRDDRPRRSRLSRGTGTLPGRDADQRHRPHPGRRPARCDRRAGIWRLERARGLGLSRDLDPDRDDRRWPPRRRVAVGRLPRGARIARLRVRPRERAREAGPARRSRGRSPTCRPTPASARSRSRSAYGPGAATCRPTSRPFDRPGAYHRRVAEEGP